MLLCEKVRRKLEYIGNKSSRYVYPAANGGWQKKAGAVYGDETTGSVFDPCVLFSGGIYRMYVSERKRNGVDVCISSDCVHWEKMGQALGPDEGSNWEEKVNRVSVCFNAGKWYMWYTGQNAAGGRIGIAVSEDGYSFHRIGSSPVLRPELPFEKQSVMNPCVLWDEEKSVYRMWYAAGELFEPDVLCYAESPDGVHWEKYADNPVLEKSGEKYDCCKVGGCDVIKEDGKYCMFYIGYQNVDTARICMAVSENGITGWIRCAENPILSPEKGAWDADAVYKPSVLTDRDEKKLLLWYNGRKRECERIGLAEKTLLF